jgi:predicted MFS family arabinose efflux permease
MNEPPPPQRSLTHFLALNRTVLVVLVSVLFFGLGEQLWSDFMPVYLKGESKSLSKTAEVAGYIAPLALFFVGIYDALRNLFESFCYISGGRLTAQLGDRGSLMLFGTLTVTGYVLFLISTLAGSAAAPLAVGAALLVLGWEPLSVPATFTTVGATVAVSGRGMAFALQSIQKRLPKIIGPLIAGFVFAAANDRLDDPASANAWAMRWLVGGSLCLGLFSLMLQFRFMPHRQPPPPGGPSSREIVRRFDPQLRRLLLAEVFTRWCDWMVRDFVILYIVFVRGVSYGTVGMLFAVQHTTAFLTYIPIGLLTRRTGLQPFVGVTFIFFALFPLALAVVPTGDAWLVLAFIVYGLREIGEPARKALITSLLPEDVRARGVGLYWGIRAFAMCPAAIVGATLWSLLGPQVLLLTAFGSGCLGAALFYLRPSESAKRR